MKKCYTNTRKIQRKGDKIYYHLMVDNKTDIFTYNDELYKILKNTRLLPYRNKTDDGAYMLRFVVNEKGKPHQFYAYDLAYGCYHGHIKAETFLEDVEAFKKYKRGRGLTTDHLMDNRYNNTIYNLSLMKRVENARKSNITERVVLPNKLACAYVDDKYRVLLTQKGNGKTINFIDDFLKRHGVVSFDYSQTNTTLPYLCENANELVRALREIIKLRCAWTVPMRNGNVWRKGESIVDNLEQCIAIQERLAKMPVENFKNKGVF